MLQENADTRSEFLCASHSALVAAGRRDGSQYRLILTVVRIEQRPELLAEA